MSRSSTITLKLPLEEFTFFVGSRTLAEAIGMHLHISNRYINHYIMRLFNEHESIFITSLGIQDYAFVIRKLTECNELYDLHEQELNLTNSIATLTITYMD